MGLINYTINFSGVGTQAVYKINSLANKISPFPKSDMAVKRRAITQKRLLEKGGHAVADRYAITAAMAGPAIPIPVVSQGAAAVYAISPKTAKSIPGVGKLIGKVESSKMVKATSKPVHQATDYLFKAGKH